MAVLLGTTAYQVVGATTGEPSPPDDKPEAQRLDCATEEAGSDEHSAIRAVWSQVDAAWNARDAEGFSRLFAEDVSFTFVQRGQSLDGRATILEHFSDRFPHFAPDLRHRTRIGAIHAIAPGIFAADGNVEIVRHADSRDAIPTVLREFAIFAVMSGQDQDWSIRALRIYELSTSTDDAGGSSSGSIKFQETDRNW